VCKCPGPESRALEISGDHCPIEFSGVFSNYELFSFESGRVSVMRVSVMRVSVMRVSVMRVSVMRVSVMRVSVMRVSVTCVASIYMCVMRLV
jgi:hypothetical protein